MPFDEERITHTGVGFNNKVRAYERFLNRKRKRSGFSDKIDNMENDQECYVYAILVDGVVRYIGKGRNARMTEHMTIARRITALRSKGHKIRGSLFYNKLAKALATGAVVEPKMIVGGLTDDAAFDLERHEIATRDGLWNLFSGGRGSTREDCLKAWDNPERRARHHETMKAFLASPGVRQRISDGTRRALSDPVVAEARRQTQLLAAQRPENKAKKSAAAKANWSDPETKAKFRAVLDQETTRRKMSESAKRRGITPDQRAKMNASLKARLADPAERERYSRTAMAAASPEVREKISAASKARWENPESRAKVVAAQRAARERSVDGHH